MTESSSTEQRLTGALADRYRIERELGQGGMATVYLAEDVRHRRKVALKVLHPELSAVIGSERFLKEIELTASLQHPHILPLFDSGTTAGHPEHSEGSACLFYVMPYVEGETLRSRLERERQLPIADALRIAREVADALAYAHERGVIHRDIKPENILLQGGHALVADFGIALAVQQAGGQRMTQTGLSLGTPQYMAPEQAMGERTIDARADIYALGAVLYEMLTGEPPFTGPTVQAIVARVLTASPASLTAARATVPQHVDHAVLTALSKLPADRFDSAKAFSDALSNPTFTTAATGQGAAIHMSQRGVSPRLFYPVSALAIASLVAALWAWQRPVVTTVPPRVRFMLELPDSQAFIPTSGVRTLAVSPDGSEITYIGVARGGRLLYRRRLDDTTVRAVPGSANPNSAIYAPTGELAFENQERTLITLPTDGRPGARIAENAGRVSWGDGDVIVFLRGSSLWRTNSHGGPITRLTTVDSAAGEGHTLPFVLPGGKAVLFNHFREARASDERYVEVVRIADGVVKRLAIKGMSPRYVSSGHILVTQGGTVLAAPFDLRTLELRGPAVRVLEGVFVRSSGEATFDVSRNGVLAYVQGGESVQPVIVGRDGREHAFGFAPGEYAHPRLSPNGDRVVVEQLDGARSDIWIVTRATGQPFRLTHDGRSSSPEWSADGQRVGWIQSDSSGASIRWQRADGSGKPELIPTPHRAPFRFVFMPDNKSAAVVVGGPFRHDIVRVALDGASEPRPITEAEGDELQPSISPDGQWMAFTSNETGRGEVFVTNTSDPSTRVQVTTEPASEPVWLADGRSLIVRSGNSFLKVSLSFSPRIEVTRRDTLFADGYRRGSPDRFFDVSRTTGELVTLARAGSKRDRIIVVTGWLDELRQRMAQAAKP